MRFWKTKPVPHGTHLGIVVATYDQPLLVTLGSIQAQTYQDFTCLVVHDGPPTKLFDRAYSIFACDTRFEFANTENREKVFGHNSRRRGFSSFLSRRTPPDFLGTTNGDNYHVPVFFEALLSAASASPSGWALCDMVHSHRQWQTIVSKPVRKFVDAGNWLARSSLVERSGPWSDAFAADWEFVARMLKHGGPPAKVPHTLFVHN